MQDWQISEVPRRIVPPLVLERETAGQACFLSINHHNRNERMDTSYCRLRKAKNQRWVSMEIEALKADGTVSYLQLPTE